MTEMAGEPIEGLTLQEALECFSDPAVWKAYLTAAAKVPAQAPPRPSRYLMSSSSSSWPRGAGACESDAYEQLVAKRDRPWRELVRAFAEKLRRGELLATGYEYPLRPGAVRVPITPDHWEVLRPQFQSSSAKGGGLKLIQVRVFEADAIGDVEGDIPEETAIETLRGPGRPSRMAEIEQEMIRRHKAGQLEPTLSGECRALASWNNKSHPERTYKWESLRRPLRALYHGLRRGKN